MLHAVVEGHLDGRLLRVLLTQLGHDTSSMVVKDAGGSGVWKTAQRFNEAGRHRTVLGLADLEQTPCPVMLLARLKGGKAAGFKLRLAVRMLESWIMAAARRLPASLASAWHLFLLTLMPNRIPRERSSPWLVKARGA